MNILENGAVLPHGLLSENASDSMAGFNKSYKNFPLRVGVVVASYPVTDTRNRSKLTTEYDILVVEQNADIGATTILYRNCMSSQGLGSIADYFEAALRPMQKKTNKGSINLNDQNGAVVLMLCLDGMSDKGIVIGALNHPDRETNLQDAGPLLVGEYNGVKITVNADGSTSLVFQGATDNDGNVIDATQGNTTIQVEKDGSFQADHDSITFRMDRNGTATLNAKKDINLVTATNLNITSTADTNVQCNNAIINATQKANVTTGSDATVQVGGDCNVTADGKVNVRAKEIDLNGSSGQVLTNQTDPVIDSIFGEPTQGVATVKAG